MANDDKIAASRAPWFRCFPSDCLSATRGLKLTEVGVLSVLTWMMHERGSSIPEDVDRLARRCGATKSVVAKAISTLVEEGMIIRTPDGLWSEDVQREIDFRAQKISNQKTAAEMRWQKTKQNQGAENRNAMPYQRQRQKPEAYEGGNPSEGSPPSTRLPEGKRLSAAQEVDSATGRFDAPAAYICDDDNAPFGDSPPFAAEDMDTADGSHSIIPIRKTSDLTVAEFHDHTTMLNSFGAIPSDAHLWLAPAAQRFLWKHIDTSFGHDALEAAREIYHAGLFAQTDLAELVLHYGGGSSGQAKAIEPARMG